MPFFLFGAASSGIPIFSSFLTYIVSTYVALPIVWKTSSFVYDKVYYDVCPVIKCFPTIMECVQQPICKDWLDTIAQCNDESSDARQQSAQTYSHVQHPTDAAYCQYQSFDAIQSPVALDFVECIGMSGCIKPATHTDMCADMSPIQDKVLSLTDTIPSTFLDGTWYKWGTTGWDLWQCQYTDFWSPDTTTTTTTKNTKTRPRPPPDGWMTEWPTNPNVWRMDLYWQNSIATSGASSSSSSSSKSHQKHHDDNVTQGETITFHMNNEMYVGQTWNYTTPGTTVHEHPPYVDATLRTRAVMWGTEAHENWYLLDYHAEWQSMMVYYCAHTQAVDRFDSMIMVLKRRPDSNVDDEDNEEKEEEVDGTDDRHNLNNDPRPCKSSSLSSSLYSPTSEQRTYYEELALKLLGPEHGGILKLLSPSCDC